MANYNMLLKLNNIQKAGLVYLTISFIFSILSLFFYHMFFGILGIGTGLIAYKEGYESGTISSTLSLIFMLMGMLLTTLMETYFKLLLSVFIITG